MLDSSVLIADEKGKLDLAALLRHYQQEDPMISSITASELLMGVERAANGAMRMKRGLYVEWHFKRLASSHLVWHKAGFMRVSGLI